MNPGSRLLCIFLMGILSGGALFARAVTGDSVLIIDGRFQDWQHRAPAYIDAEMDQQTGSIDFGKLWIANTQRFLMMRLQVGGEILLQDQNAITMLVDTDHDTSTGERVGDMGADLIWTFGQRSGRWISNGQSTNINHYDIGLVTAPTTTSDEFEISLDRWANLEGTPLFQSDTIGIAFVDGGEGADQLPDGPVPVEYVFQSGPVPALQPIGLSRAKFTDLRVMTYNVLNDGFLDANRRDAFARLFGAIQPDVIALEEMYATSASEAKAQIADFLHLQDTGNFHAAKVDPDIVMVSRFPILSVLPVQGNGAFLLDLKGVGRSQMLFIVAHLPCCRNDQGRNFEIDAILAFLRQAKQHSGDLSLVPNTPIVILGDLNLVGQSTQLQRLLTGDVEDETQFGPDFQPDWDQTALADLQPRHPFLPFTYTWISPSSSFSPGRLDFILYSNSVLMVQNSYILFTRELPQDTLMSYGLKEDDALVASDHLPLVADLQINSAMTGVKQAFVHSPAKVPIAVFQNYPNPFNQTTRIMLQMNQSANVQIKIYATNGKLVRTLFSGSLQQGENRFNWDGRNSAGQKVASGLYFLHVSAAEMVIRRKVVLLQ